MAHFDPGPVPKEITPKWMKNLLTYLQDCLNYLNENNFPNKISGGIISPRTLSVYMSELEWKEFHIPLVLPATPVNTTSETGTNLGGYFVWNPTAFRGGNWYLEASIAISNTSGTAKCTLTGAVDIGSVTTKETGMTVVRSEKLTMPATSQGLWVKLSTDDESYTATLGAARLIFIPS